MRMLDFVVREAILPELTANTKEGVIREMVDSLVRTNHFQGADPEDIVRAILKREQIASTGIGRGVAIPHAKHDGVDRLVSTVALSTPGVPFDSLDGEPVHIFVLLISPQDRPGDHLRALHVHVDDDDPTAAITLADLAAEARLSRFQLVRNFAKSVGLTPHAYIVQRRIDLARRLIGEKNWAEADRVRDELLAQGIQLKDGKDPSTGERVTTWEVKR